MARVLVVDTESWRVSALLQSLWPTVREVTYVNDPHQIASVTEPLAAAVVVMRDSLQLYLSAICDLKSRVRPPHVLAIFASGGLPAHYALTAARVRGADAVLYNPHSEVELTDAVLTILVARSSL